MAWIASQQGLKDSHKLFDLMASMEWIQPLAVGHLQMLWWWCIDHAEDGDLSKFKPSHIAIAAGVAPVDCNKFVDAMIEAGFIDKKPYLRLHDWWDHFGTFLKTKYRQRPEGWNRVEKLYSDKEETSAEHALTPVQDMSNTSASHVSDTDKTRQPNLTKPNLTKPREITPKPPEPEEGGASPPVCSKNSPRSQSKSGREDRAQVKPSMQYPSDLNTDRFIAEFEDWIDHRMGLRKPGVRWSVFFQKQLDKELATLDEQAAFEMVKNSTIQGYTGLYAKKQPTGRNRAPSEDEIDQTKF